jgi:alkanesulfonate monooxygenase SsuD/methylene tetrahydromethanopterin reductase-like flavin-dependent oxidoreductase (luciferase family)
VWLLGSSTFGAQLAARLGLPFAFASHFAPAQLFPALQIYHSSFKPSSFLKEPYAMACVNVVAADTDEHAHYLSTSAHQLVLGLIRNNRKPLAPPTANYKFFLVDAAEGQIPRCIDQRPPTGNLQSTIWPSVKIITYSQGCVTCSFLKRLNLVFKNSTPNEEESNQAKFA